MAAKDITIQISRPAVQLMNVTIRGTAPLIFHKWSDKAKKMITDKQAKKANKARETRDPKAEYKDSYYYDAKGKIAFPSLNVKQAIVAASRSLDGVPMTIIRQNIFVMGDKDGFIPVKYKSEEMREDMVRVGMGVADIRYRGQVNDWTMTFQIKWNAGKFSAEQVINLLAYAGFSSGLGEWRPERNGDFGTFEVE